MKKLVAMPLMLMLALVFALPAFAEAGDTATIQANVDSGVNNINKGWTDNMKYTSQEMSKGEGMGQELTGLVAGSVVGARNAVHRIGAGAIDLLTFWIPKDKPLISE
jgi:hypothetical protein